MTKTAPPISVGVIIPAAGSSKRLGGLRKQFRLLDGKPLLVQTALAFEHHPEISTITIVAPDDAVNEVAQSCQDYGLSKISSVVAGGRTRQDSVRIGLDALPPEVEIVITHDAARPFIAANEISRLIEQTVQSGAASTAASVSDTLCRSVGGVAGETVSRDGLFRMLTPQGFRRAVLIAGHEQAEKVYTDEVTLVRAAGFEVALIETSLINIKITTQADWDLATWMWPAWRNA